LMQKTYQHISRQVKYYEDSKQQAHKNIIIMNQHKKFKAIFFITRKYDTMLKEANVTTIMEINMDHIHRMELIHYDYPSFLYSSIASWLIPLDSVAIVTFKG
ncbi:hypothetical protein ACJX0J_022213, partial [Zea mays]